MSNKTVTSSKFGIMSYYRMLKNKGLSYALGYFVNNQLWDIINHTDTHKRLMKYDYQEHDLDNFEFAVGYGTSWNIEINKSFLIVKNLVENMNDFNFIDVGCGKGKVLILWKQLIKKYAVNQDIIGIEYSQILTDIAKDNYKKLIGDAVNIETNDITKINLNTYGKKVIIYLYNPFTGDVFKDFIKGLKGLNVILIYNNPACHDEVINTGFTQIDEFVICTRETKIYSNFKL